MITEILYLICRRTKALTISAVYFLFRIFPIQKQKIVFSAFEGGGYGCNPKYIAEELIKRINFYNKKYKLLWLVNDETKRFPSEIMPIKNTFWNRVYHLATAEAWIDNSRKEFGALKRSGQLYIQTWHGNIGFKAMGLWRGDGFSKIARMVSEHDSGLIDYVIIDSEWCREMFPDGMLYYGNFLATGTPRCDILHDVPAGLHEKVRRLYGLSDDAKILLYAPTFRETGQKTKRRVYSSYTGLDFAELINSLETKFPGQWYIFMRLHPQLATAMNCEAVTKNNNRLIDVSSADDVYEILAVTDALITDYSSLAFDACLAKIPVFIYAEDLDTYAHERGDMQWIFSRGKNVPILNNPNMTPNIKTKLPFGVAETNQELREQIKVFDTNAYNGTINNFLQDVGMIFDGNASERVADIIAARLNTRHDKGEGAI